jgi:hypothetical protein
MLVAYRLAGLSALETYYAGVRVGAQFRPDAALQVAFRRSVRGRPGPALWTPWGSWVAKKETRGRRRAPMAKRRPGSFSGEAPIEPAPAACACVTSAQVKDLLLGRRSGRRQDDARSDRRGPADGATGGGSHPPTRSIDRHQYGRAAI